MIENNDLFLVRQFIERCVGMHVQLLANKGRRKAIIKEGVIEHSYPNIFTVRVENEFDSTRRISYSYTDVLTKVVELIINKEEQASSVMPANNSEFAPLLQQAR